MEDHSVVFLRGSALKRNAYSGVHGGGLDVMFSKVQLNAVMGMFGASMQQRPATNIWKVAEWWLKIAHDV